MSCSLKSNNALQRASNWLRNAKRGVFVSPNSVHGSASQSTWSSKQAAARQARARAFSIQSIFFLDSTIGTIKKKNNDESQSEISDNVSRRYRWPGLPLVY